MGPRIKEIRERLEEVESRSNHLHLKVMLKSQMLIPGKRHPTSSIIDESIVFGRETDREKVVGLLTSDDDSLAANSGIQVVPICGMGGLGKTTLAQLAYNDERVVKHFEVKAWVYVSQDFNLIRLANAIVKSVTGSDPHLTNLDPFRVSIKEALKGKKFLLVLDDVWNENCNDWDELRAPLMVGARGSRILVTTRSKRVSSNMGTLPTHSLQGLSDDDCWSLFESRAFVQGNNSDAHPDLVKIGKKIINKCNGLPLAVKTLGELPSYWSNLVNLRHLRLYVLNESSVSIPPRIGTLKGLQTLRYFNVGKEIGRGINELKDLIHLRGCLRISELENVVNVEEAKEAQLKNKQKIDELKLRWKCDDDVELRQEGIEEEVLNALQPHTNLKKLAIEGYHGVRFPTYPTGFDLVLGAVEQLLHLRGGQCKFILAHIPQVKMMDAMAVNEAI
ncbi:hypothetical protein AAC387_Pa01g1690 [Persea americana]